MFHSVCQGHSLTVSNLQYFRKYETLKVGQERCLSGLLSVMYRKLTRIIGAATNFAEGRIKHNERSAKKSNSLSDGLNFQTYTSIYKLFNTTWYPVVIQRSKYHCMDLALQGALVF